MKHKIEAIDTENFSCTLSLIEGDILFDRLESAVYEVKFEPSTHVSGCICKMNSYYQAKMAVHLNDKDIEMGKDKALGLYKIIEDYLIQNPNVCA